MECYKKNNDNSTKTNRIKPYNKEKQYDDGGNENYNASSGKSFDLSNNYEEKKRINDQHFFQSLYAPAGKRLLSRRYPLTKDGRKYLEIGINIASKSVIEIVLGEVYKKEVVFNINEWKNLIEYIHVIQVHVKSKAATIIPLCKINDSLYIEVRKYKDMNLVYLIENEHYIILSLQTVSSLLNFNDCIHVHHKDLSHMIDQIDGILVHEIKEEEEDYLEYDKSNKLICELYAMYPFVRNKYVYV